MASEMKDILVVSTQSVLLLLFFTGSSFCAPAIDNEIVYDQRQNGTENYRVRINDVIVVHAPLEALVALASAADESVLQQLGLATSSPGTTGADLGNTSTESTSAVTLTTESKPKQGSQKPDTKSKSRLMLAELLLPFLRRL
ncbi:uncharacterized protein LOC110835617 [Zootermopsis nevadensis]|uniref:Uncharacterized protein n=1 Tax=Zootermopsis nevadensis TaxID=136037 RepID=A0A067R2G5_ZOONE|nr:uncharacterized protein LOC110835617 [Zootermopsis nevadensis]KDR13160.1 hypothetical protein L798_11344 [Zootermopsis nevadensis]